MFARNRKSPELREEALKSRCLRDYRAVTPMNGAPLFVRRDLVDAYLANEPSPR